MIPVTPGCQHSAVEYLGDHRFGCLVPGCGQSITRLAPQAPTVGHRP